MTAAARALPSRDTTATRLLRASERRSFDPRTEIDWAAPFEDNLFFAPPQGSGLYGTDLWEAMPRAQQIELSRCELANTTAMAVWFELTFFPLLVGELLRRPYTSDHVRYGLTELGDECRHSWMFSTMLEKLGRGPFPVNRFDYALTFLLRELPLPGLTWVAVLFVEEVFDAVQRDAMSDEQIQPLCREMFRIHVTEEARHMRYARDELAREAPSINQASKELLANTLGLGLGIIARCLHNPAVYAAAGLDPRKAQAAVRSNHRHREFLHHTTDRMRPFFDDLGLITPAARVQWRRAGFLP